MNLQEHPSVVKARSQQRLRSNRPLEAGWLREVALAAGADDVGFVSIDDPAVEAERETVLRALPQTRTLVALVKRMSRAAIRSPARSIANHEFHHAGDEVGEVGRDVVTALESRGVDAVNPAMGFPMDMETFPDRMWVVSHKTVAVAAGLGVMGIHRNVIHPKFGNFILLGTVLVGADVDQASQPLDYNPCVECKLCVAACPVGAIGSDGSFQFSACYTHNYREFMGGFTDWVESIADSRNARDYRSRVRDSESASMWQSLSYGANYKAAYCMAVCPAGEDVLGPFLDDRRQFVRDVVQPLKDRPEPVYVVPGSDAEAYVKQHSPHKEVRAVDGVLRPDSIEVFLGGLELTFQRRAAGELSATYHFRFHGESNAEATVRIHDGRLTVERGCHGEADLEVRADARSWLSFLRKDGGLLWPLLTRRIRLRGSPRLLLAFGRCFRS